MSVFVHVLLPTEKYRVNHILLPGVTDSFRHCRRVTIDIAVISKALVFIVQSSYPFGIIEGHLHTMLHGAGPCLRNATLKTVASPVFKHVHHPLAPGAQSPLAHDQSTTSSWVNSVTLQTQAWWHEQSSKPITRKSASRRRLSEARLRTCHRQLQTESPRLPFPAPQTVAVSFRCCLQTLRTRHHLQLQAAFLWALYKYEGGAC